MKLLIEFFYDPYSVFCFLIGRRQNTTDKSGEVIQALIEREWFFKRSELIIHDDHRLHAIGGFAAGRAEPE